MTITIDILRKAGCSSELIVRILELEQSERLPKRREQNRINKRNQRLRQQVSADHADHADHADKEKEEKKESTKERKEERETSSLRSSGRASRLPENWKPINGDHEYALKILPKDWRIEAEKFRNYWIARPGQQGVKLNWSATWRNWLLKAAESKGYAPELFDQPVSKAPLTDEELRIDEQIRNAAKGIRSSDQKSDRQEMVRNGSAARPKP